MTLLGDISYGIGGNDTCLRFIADRKPLRDAGRDARCVPPVETREGSQALSSQRTGASGEPNHLNKRRAASTPGANSDASVGCGWRLVYESELKQVFLDLVERDGETVVMRIPRESLVRFLRGVADAESAPHSAAEEAQLDLLA